MDLQSQAAAFEQRVARAYRNRGYVVDHDLNVGGHQIDVVAELPHREEWTRVAVEAKFHADPRRSTRKEQVLSFSLVAADLLARGLVSHCVMVTNTKYTPAGQEVVGGDHRIRLLTLDDITNSTFLSQHMETSLSEYLSSPISSFYVELELEAVSADERREIVGGSELLEMAGQSDGPIVVLGDFGSGKTTLVDRLFFGGVRQLLDQKTGLVPCRLILREFEESAGVDQFVRHQTLRDLGVEVGLAALRERAERGEIALLLDGFDEISSTTTKKDRARFVELLAPLLFSGSPTVLTSRPSHFEDWKEITQQLRRRIQFGVTRTTDRSASRLRILGELQAEEVAKLRERFTTAPDRARSPRRPTTLHMRSLDADAIVRYLEAVLGSESDARLAHERLLETYDLGDLMRRPLLLAMVGEMLTAGSLDLATLGNAVGPAALYEMYTEVKAALDVDKQSNRAGAARSVLVSAKHRLAFAEECAWAMLQQEHLELTQARTEELVRSSTHLGLAGSAQKSRGDLERTLTDLRTCSFLTTTPSGSLRFTHKSFQEFFAARWLLEQLHAGTLDRASALTREQCYFLGSMLREAPESAELVERTIGAQGRLSQGRDDLLVTSLLSGRLYSGRAIEGLQFRPTCRVVEISRTANELHEAILGDVRVDGLSLSRLRFEDSRLGSIDLGEVSGSTVDLVQSTCRDMSMSGSESAVLALASSSRFRITGDVGVTVNESDVEFKNCRARAVSMTRSSGKFSQSELGGALSIAESTIVISDSCRFTALEANDSVIEILDQFTCGTMTVERGVVNMLNWKGRLESSEVNLLDCLVILPRKFDLLAEFRWSLKGCAVVGGYVPIRNGKLASAAVGERFKSSLLACFEQGGDPMRIEAGSVAEVSEGTPLLAPDFVGDPVAASTRYLSENSQSVLCQTVLASVRRAHAAASARRGPGAQGGRSGRGRR